MSKSNLAFCSILLRFSNPAAGGGYGATIGERGDDIVVSKLRPGGAAADAGLRVGDVVLSVRGWDATRQDFDDVHDRCKAAAGARAPLLLLVARENDAEAMPPPAPREPAQPAAATTPPPFLLMSSLLLIITNV